MTELQKRMIFFLTILIVLLYLFFFRHFLFPPVLPLASHSIMLKPFLARAYQHICPEELVFPSIFFTACFPKTLLDPRTAPLALRFPSGPPGAEKPGCETKDPRLTTLSN